MTLGAVFVSQDVFDQETVPVPAQQDVDRELVPHPAHIVTGTCSSPGEIRASLGYAAGATGDPEGADPMVHVDVIANTGLFIPLDDLLATDHAIVVRNSDSHPDTMIACGEIGGHFVGASFLVGLAPVGDSGFAGAAWLTEGEDRNYLRLTLTNIDAAAGASDS